MSFLDSWIAEKIADNITVASVIHPTNIALQTKDKLVGSYIELRTDYGKKHHWPLNEQGVDIDVYDYDKHTRYFLSLEKSGWGRRKLSAGMRLTKTPVFEDSLSLSMWAHAVDKPHVVAQLIDKKHDVEYLKKTAHDGKLWDLTRLVTAMSLQEKRSPQTKRATYVALLLTLGAAFKYTGQDSVWFFTTNIEVKRFLDRLGIQYSQLAAGKISYSDTGESFLAWCHVGQSYEQLRKGQPVVAGLIERGYEQGSVRQSGSNSVS